MELEDLLEDYTVAVYVGRCVVPSVLRVVGEKETR
jgi:hypothetical protein